MNEIISKLYAAIENSGAIRNLEVDETAEVNVTLTIAEIYSILNVLEEK
jgi:alpha-galactosidase/6-phospho-beta-glucosidase family protein